jgi:phospholipid transport system substrate-binding protein
MLSKNFEAPNRRSVLSQRDIRRTAIVAFTGMLLFVVAAVVTPPPAAAASNAQAVVKEVIDEALPILRDRQAPLAQRRRKLRDLLEHHFDFGDMARTALGYHWRQLTPDQRVNFTQLFTAFIENAYLSKIQYYSGQNVEILGQNSEGTGFARVRSKIVEQGKQPIAVDYLLRHMSDHWKIYDVTVDNISIIANYRNQFNRVINDQGYAKLIADMRAKQEALRASLGS